MNSNNVQNERYTKYTIKSCRNPGFDEFLLSLMKCLIELKSQHCVQQR